MATVYNKSLEKQKRWICNRCGKATPTPQCGDCTRAIRATLLKCKGCKKVSSFFNSEQFCRSCSAIFKRCGGEGCKKYTPNPTGFCRTCRKREEKSLRVAVYEEVEVKLQMAALEEVVVKKPQVAVLTKLAA